MTSRFAEIIPPFHRRGNRIPFAAIRWPDFGNQPSLGRPFAQISRHSDTPLLSFYLAVDVPGLRRSWSWSQIIDQAQDFPEQFPRHRHLGQLEGDVAAMADHLGTDLHQLLPQRGQRPVLHLLRQSTGTFDSALEAREHDFLLP